MKLLSSADILWAALVPPIMLQSTFVSIDGGNHGQFGSYGMQKGDHAPEITEDEQLHHVVQALDDWFNSLNK
ncbi:hypothetical protein D3C73_891160 [compost metagenome]